MIHAIERVEDGQLVRYEATPPGMMPVGGITLSLANGGIQFNWSSRETKGPAPWPACGERRRPMNNSLRGAVEMWLSEGRSVSVDYSNDRDLILSRLRKGSS